MLARIRHQASAVAAEANAARTVVRDATRDASEAGSPGKGLRIESAGPPEGTSDQLEIPIRLIDDATGRETTLRLKLTLDEA